jgi:hypothetical protein
MTQQDSVRRRHTPEECHKKKTTCKRIYNTRKTSEKRHFTKKRREKPPRNQLTKINSTDNSAKGLQM